MTETGSGSLFDDFQALLATVPGAPERERILSLLPGAQRVELEDDLVSAISSTLAHEAYTIEHNLDFLIRPSEVTWFEWSEAARGTDVDVSEVDKEQPVRVGLLLTRHEEHPDITVGTVAWRLADGRTDHAPAFFSFNEEHMATLAKSARHSYSRIQTEVWARMLSLIYTHVPDGFVGEMEELADLREGGPGISDMTDAARLEVSAEALFIIGVLLMLQTPSAELQREGGRLTASVSAADKPMGWQFWKKPGFSRKSRRDGVRLRYLPA